MQQTPQPRPCNGKPNGTISEQWTKPELKNVRFDIGMKNLGDKPIAIPKSGCFMWMHESRVRTRTNTPLTGFKTVRQHQHGKFVGTIQQSSVCHIHSQ